MLCTVSIAVKTFGVCDFSRLAVTDWRLRRWRLWFWALLTATRFTYPIVIFGSLCLFLASFIKKEKTVFSKSMWLFARMPHTKCIRLGSVRSSYLPFKMHYERSSLHVFAPTGENTWRKYKSPRAFKPKFWRIFIQKLSKLRILNCKLFKSSSLRTNTCAMHGVIDTFKTHFAWRGNNYTQANVNVFAIIYVIDTKILSFVFKLWEDFCWPT